MEKFEARERHALKSREGDVESEILVCHNRHNGFDVIPALQGGRRSERSFSYRPAAYLSNRPLRSTIFFWKTMHQVYSCGSQGKRVDPRSEESTVARDGNILKG